MATSYTGLRVQDTYNAIIKIGDNSNLTGTPKLLSDGLGNDSPLYLSTTRLGIGISPAYQFHTSGNAKIGGNLIVSGNLTVNGTLTYLNVQDLAVEDPIIKLAKDNTANTLDIGLFGKYVATGTKYKGFFNDASDDKFKLFIGTTVEPTTTVDTSASGYTIGTLVANLEGNVTGNVTGNLTGNVTGDVTGNVTGDVTGNVTGDVTGNLSGNVTGNLTGNVTGGTVSGTTATFSSIGQFAGAIRITETSTAQRILIGNQDSGGVNKPAIIMGANANLYFGYGDSWTGEGGNITNILVLSSADSSSTFSGNILPNADSTYNIGANNNKWAEGHFDHLYIGETGNNPRIDIYTEDETAAIADTFADTTTDKSYIYFNAGTSSNDPGYIMHETSNSETNEGVLHLVPTDDNDSGDYVSIHGTNDPDALRLHTNGLIETANGIGLQLTSDSGTITLNDNLSGTQAIFSSSTAPVIKSISSSTAENILLEGTDTTASSAPDLVLYRNAGATSDNDTLGVVEFRGRNDANTGVKSYSGIYSRIIDASENEGALSFSVNSGSSYVNALAIHNTGVNQPKVIIGNTDAFAVPTHTLDVDGTFHVSSTGTFVGQLTIPETPTADAHAASKKYVDDSTANVDVAKRLEVTVKNVSGGSLAKGTVVHAAPTATPPSGNVIEVIAADANDATKMPSIGVLNETIANEAEGEAVMFGAVSGIDTSSFSIGDELYVSTTAGEFTATKPTANDELVQKVAIVIKSHASNGLIKVFGANRANDVPNQIDRNVNFTDNSKLTFGDSTTPDLEIYHDGTNSVINNKTGNLQIYNNADDKDIVFLTDNGIGGNTEYFVINGNINLNEFKISSRHNDNVKAFFGNGSDLQIYHDDTDSYIKNDTGNLIIEQTTDDADIIFKNDNGSGGTIEYFRLDGSTNTIPFGRSPHITDNVRLYFGNDTANDASMRWDSTANQLFIDGSVKFLDGLNIVGDLSVTGNFKNDLIFERASTRKIIFNSDTNFNSDLAFLYFNENSSFHRTGTENVRFSIGTFNDFSNSSAHSDALDLQGGSRLYLNVGDWDTELDSAIGTPATGSDLDDYPIQFAVNNDVKVRINDSGHLYVDSGEIVVTPSTGYGRLEIGGASGGYIDLKAPASDNYDLRFIVSQGGNEITTASGDLKINTANTLALTIDSSQNATFDGNVISKDTFYLENATGQRWQQLFDGNNWNIRYYNGSSWSADALAIDTSGNSTFAGDITTNGDIIIDNSSGDPFLKLKTSAQEYVIRIDQSDSEKFQIRNTTSGTNMISVETSGNTTITGDLIVSGNNVRSRIFESHVGHPYLDSDGANNYVKGGNNGANTLYGQYNYFRSIGHIIPHSDSTYDLGGTSNYWRNLYAINLTLHGTATGTTYTLYNGTANGGTGTTAVQYYELYSKSGAGGQDYLHFELKSFNSSEYSAEVKIFIPTYSGFSSSYGTMDEGQGIQCEIKYGGLATQTSSMIEIIETADMSSTSSFTKLYLKIQPAANNTQIQVRNYSDCTIKFAEGNSWSTTAPSNQSRSFTFDTAATNINDSLSIKRGGFVDITGDGHLFIGENNTTPKVDMMYLDHPSGAGWDTRIFIGKSNDLPNGASFPTTTAAGGYGIQFQSNSDGAFFGIEDYGSNQFRPVINWGDDTSDTPMTFRFNGSSIFTIDYQGNIAGRSGYFTGNSGLPATSGTNQTKLLRLKASNNATLDMGCDHTTANGWLQVTDVTDLSQEYSLLLQPNGGNTGIGLSNPAVKLEIQDSTHTTMKIRSGNNDNILFFQAIQSNTARIGTDTNTDLSFYTNTSERGRIKTSGNLQIYRAGNTNGGTLLIGPHGSGSNKWSYLAGTHYNQDTGSGNGSGSAGVALIGAFSDISSNLVYIGGGPYEINAATAILFWTHSSSTSTLGGSERMRIDSSGVVSVATGNLRLDGTAKLYTNNDDLTISSDDNGNGSNGKIIFKTVNNERIRIDNAGRLKFTNDLLTRKIQLWSSADNDNQFYGFGIESSTLVYSVFDVGDSHVFFTGSGTTTRNELMRIKGNGRVGINVTNPSARFNTHLAVSGTLLAYQTGTSATFDASQNIAVVHDSSAIGTNVGAGLLLANNNNSNDAISPLIAFSAKSASNSFNHTYAAIYGQKKATGADTNWNKGDLIFATSSGTGVNEVMRITKDSRVGVNMTDPQATFEVGGAGSTLRVGPRYSSGGDRDFVDLIAAGQDSKVLSNNERFHIENNSGHIVINPSAGVGIKTTAPMYNLQVQKSSQAAPAIMIGGAYYGGPRLQTYGLDADAGAWMGLGTDMSGGAYEHNVYFPDHNSNGRLSFGTYNGTTYSEKMNIDRIGRVGIGGSPEATLHVQGQQFFQFDTVSGEGTKFENHTSGGHIKIGFQQNDTDGMHHRAYIIVKKDSNGSVGGRMDFVIRNHGTTADLTALTIRSNKFVGINDETPQYQLDVSGTIRASTDVIAYSDRRLKENIITIDNALEKVTKLRGVSYNRKDVEDKSTKIGVIAQEVLEVIPEVVEQDKEGKYSVAYGNMAGVFIEAIKELKAEVESLKNEIKQLKSK